MLTLKKYYWYRKAKKLLDKPAFREGCLMYLRERAAEDLAQAEADLAEAEARLVTLQEAATARLLEALNVLEDACSLQINPPLFKAEFDQYEPGPLFGPYEDNLDFRCTDPECDICSQAQLDEEIAAEQEEEIDWYALDLEDKLLEEAQRAKAQRAEQPDEVWTTASDVWQID